MKRIILIIILLNTISFNQSSLLLLMGNGYKNAEVKEYNSALTTPLSGTRLAILDNFITKIKDSLSITSLSTSFDRLCLATETQEGMFNSIVNPTSTDMSIGATTVTYTADQGFACDNIAGYINSNFNISTSGTVFTQNSASLGIYIRDDQTDAGYISGVLSGVGSGIMFRPDNGSGYVSSGKFNSLTAQPVGFANSDTKGFYILNRTASDSSMVYKNGALKEKWAATSAALVNLSLYYGCYNSVNGTPAGFTGFQVAAIFIGKGFTGAEISKINNCVEWYLDAIGAGVIP